MPRSDNYHHGNLRQALLDAAIALIGEVGPRSFTLREVARRAGVSHNAPYRHFPDKQSLLDAVAEEGFARLTQTMVESADRGTTPIERFELCGCGYVEFALRWPNHFLVMFDQPLKSPEEKKAAVEECQPYLNSPSGNQEKIGANAFQVLFDCIVGAQASGSLSAGDPLPIALAAWSMVHGIATLANQGWLPLAEEQVVEFVRHAAKLLQNIDSK